MKIYAVVFFAAIFLISASHTHARRVLRSVNLSDDDLIVNTTSGLVLGMYGGTTEVGQKPVYMFRSIPYAEPPIGNLRFQPPVPVSYWEGVKNVSENSEICIQGQDDDIVGSEDCLFLQIQTTELPNDQKRLPVMVWIYGGVFYAGSADFETQKIDYLLDEGVLVAGLQYRVGILGFLSTEDLVAPGNNGLKDQVLALKWIKENVERFGGDPDNITVFGQSAGAASIAYLLQTPQTEGLFNRAILESGSSLCLWSLSRISLEMAESIASELNVDTSSTQALVDGLRGIEVNKLQTTFMSTMTAKLLTVNIRDGLLVAPVREPEHEGAILTSLSHQLLKEGNFHDIPIIIGHNSLEALLGDISILLRTYFLQYDLEPSRLVPIDMNITSLLKSNSVGLKIKTKYFGLSLIAGATQKLMKYISEDQFVRPIYETARLYSQKSPVYFYIFSYEGSLYGVQNRNYSGVGHSEELGYIFDFGYEGSEADYLTRSRMVKLWTNFAKTSNPTPEVDTLLQNITWQPFTEGSENYLNISTNLQLSSNPNSDAMTFWKTLYKNNANPPYDTY